MKVVFVSRSTILAVPGGDTIQMKNTANALAKFGVHIDFYQGIGDQGQLEASKYHHYGQLWILTPKPQV